ncbi:MAG: histidinol-phosphate transaminase [Ruminococcaceae bacterium]|nr:histidinol-phosphate transaminase [Oscillospiraceae bacterium]
MSRFFDGKLSSLVAYTPGEQPKNVRQLIKLNTNESPFPPSPKVFEALTREKIEELRLYPAIGITPLQEATAKFYGIRPEQVFTANGSDEALAFCFHGLCPNGAVFADLTYGFYPVFCDMFRIPMHIIPLREDFSLAIEDYAGRKETVFIANPNAPTGMYLNLDTIRALLEQDRDRLVVVDEAYVDFGGESAVSLIGEYDNLLVIQTFSKSRQLAGGRLGLAMACQELIDDLNKLKFSFNPYSVNNLTLLEGAAAMEDVEYFDACRNAIIETRARTTSALRERGFIIPESMANFIWANPVRISGKEYYEKLREKGILVRYFSGERTKQHVRITIGSEEQMQRLVAATDEIFAEV